jgi:hypothetical protein
MVSNIEALRHKVDGDHEFDLELADWEKLALLALQESLIEAKSKEEDASE